MTERISVDFSERVEAYLAVLDKVDVEAAWIVGNQLPLLTEIIRAHCSR